MANEPEPSGIDWDAIEVEELHDLVFDEDERRRYSLPSSIRHERVREREAFGGDVKSRDLVRARQRCDFHTGLIRYFQKQGRFLMLTIALPHRRGKATEEIRSEYSRLARELRDHLPVKSWGGWSVSYPECTASLRTGIHRHLHALVFVPDGVDLEDARLQLDDSARDAVERVLRRDVYWDDPAVMVTDFDADNARYFFKDTNVHGDSDSMGEADLEREIHRRRSRGMSSRAQEQLLADMRAVMKGARVSAPKAAGDLANGFASLHRQESKLVVSAEGRTTRMIRTKIRELKPLASCRGAHRLGPSTRMVRTDPLGYHDEVSGRVIRSGDRAPSIVVDNVVPLRPDDRLAGPVPSTKIKLSRPSDFTRRPPVWDTEWMSTMDDPWYPYLLNGLMDTKIGRSQYARNESVTTRHGSPRLGSVDRGDNVVHVDFSAPRRHRYDQPSGQSRFSVSNTGSQRPEMAL